MASPEWGPVPVRACVDLGHPESFSQRSDMASAFRSTRSDRAILAARPRRFNRRALQSP